MGSDTDRSIDIADPFARQLMARYLGRRENDLVSLRAALGNGDYDEIEVTGHKLFGSGSAYGLDEISSLGRSIERAAAARDAGGLDLLIADLERFLQNLRVR